MFNIDIFLAKFNCWYLRLSWLAMTKVESRLFFLISLVIVVHSEVINFSILFTLSSPMRATKSSLQSRGGQTNKELALCPSVTLGVTLSSLASCSNSYISLPSVALVSPLVKSTTSLSIASASTSVTSSNFSVFVSLLQNLSPS